jgi:uncharacterized protein (DUF885 family)
MVPYVRFMGDAVVAARTSPIDRIADAHLDRSVEVDPLLATSLGIAGHDHRMPDLSPAGLAAMADLARDTLRALDALDDAAAGDATTDEVDAVTIAALRERLGLQLEQHEAGEELCSLNVIASPLQAVRDVFDLMPTETDAHWSVIAERLRAVPAALAGYVESLKAGRERGLVSAQRQVDRCAGQCDQFSAADGFFRSFVAGADVSAQTRSALDDGARLAGQAYAELAHFLRTDLRRDAPTADAVGRERYELASRAFLGARVDLDETYAWGLAELARLEAEMAATADRIVPGATVAQAIAVLDADPSRTISGKEAFRAWMQQLADRAVAELAGRHFDIPEPVRRIECKIAPTTTGGIYYTPPSEDFSRPGSMWWAVPEGVEQFSTWREVTTVYHEGVPGHHLQCGQTAFRAGQLNRWRRLACWVSGHGEGWALYAEQLMGELGYLDDPADRLGMLDGQAFRAARVVLDIGIHTGQAAPPEVGGGAWDYTKAWQFLTSHARMGEAMLRFELDRYLGWPGQAPSYKVGERIWTQLRDEVARREGAAFDLAAFHRRALDVGSVGLDVLRAVLAPPTAG